MFQKYADNLLKKEKITQGRKDAKSQSPELAKDQIYLFFAPLHLCAFALKLFGTARSPTTSSYGSRSLPSSEAKGSGSLGTKLLRRSRPLNETTLFFVFFCFLCALCDSEFTSLQGKPVANAEYSENVTLINHLPMGGRPVADVFVQDDYAYLSILLPPSLTILDVSNPENPQTKGSVLLNVDGYALEIFVQGGYAYIAVEAAGLCIVDVRDRSNPRVVANIDLPSIDSGGGSAQSTGVYVHGIYAYLADGFSGLRIINISNPSAPTEAGSIDTPSYAWDVRVVGNYAYVADGFDGLRVLDVSNPSSPTEVGGFDTAGDARGVYVVGNYAYVADESNGLSVINIANPFSPEEVASIGANGATWGVHVSSWGDKLLAYMATWIPPGLRVIDVTDPTALSLVGYYTTSATSSRVCVAGGMAYLADASGGLYILQYSDIPVPVKLSSFVAISDDDGVRLKWTSASEIDNIGWNIYRSSKKDGKYTKINSNLIKGAGASATPHTYQYIDDTVEKGYYYIEAIDYKGRREKSPIIYVLDSEENLPSIINRQSTILGLMIDDCRLSIEKILSINNQQSTIDNPGRTALLQNYPNPFNPETWIPYQLASNANVTIRIYNINGSLVRTLSLGEKEPGFYVSKEEAAYWDGRNESGETVASGVYFYHIKAGSFAATKRMVILK